MTTTGILYVIVIRMKESREFAASFHEIDPQNSREEQTQDFPHCEGASGKIGHLPGWLS